MLPKRSRILITDIGGVLTPKRGQIIAERIARDYGLSQSKVMETYSVLCGGYDTGTVSDKEFVQNFNDTLGTNLTVSSWYAYNKYNVNEERISELVEIASTWRLASLSNSTPSLTHHFPYRHLFEVSAFSEEIGLRKPNIKAWEHVLDRMGCKANDCVYIDDNIFFVEVARQMGMESIQYVGQPISEVVLG